MVKSVAPVAQLVIGGRVWAWAMTAQAKAAMAAKNFMAEGVGLVKG